MIRSAIALVAMLALAACGGGRHEASNTTTDGGNDTGSAQNALGGTGSGPALKGGGGVQNPGDASGNNPQGEVSPPGPGGGNSTG